MRVPMVSVVIPVGGNRSNHLDKMDRCIESIMMQGYPNLEIILVIDPDNFAVLDHEFVYPVRLIAFERDSRAVGRDTIARAVAGWDVAHGEILGLTGVSLVWREDLLDRAMGMLLERGVAAVDGVTRRLPDGDRRFMAMFQDEAFITEFPLYKKDFRLCGETFAMDSRLPTLTSFLMTRKLYGRIRDKLPKYADDGWEDFDVARAIVDAGEAINCSNLLVAYRNHLPSLRLSKQFLSGMSCATFYQRYPDNSYAQRRLSTALKVSVMMMVMLLVGVGITAVAVSTDSVLMLFLVIIAGCVALGLLNSVKAKHWYGMFFPPLMFMQIAAWMAGFFYAGLNQGEFDSDFVRWLHSRR
ncbi:hypothetical protein A2368_03930 [Candidatus Collierbacteria bacterium RIFOXYB1_FULL_49_13]|uniref:Glycosyltransferase 2-like domain-containing protein n=1 Tax=Candidatus Collierbacteria bacterium RIFOXYB1_FULL_49_13 TaxID=1817728 RepID=A0A1F5FJD6_9BACT|nr:MAG: hypothetical protein A2368_03930 [Candidatus Collierbacteria bacterium RIFOXYB1_FULL_49_13]